MAQQAKVFVEKPNDLSSVPKTCLIEGELCLLQTVL